jgi:hypothetical protein
MLFATGKRAPLPRAWIRRQRTFAIADGIAGKGGEKRDLTLKGLTLTFNIDAHSRARGTV